MSDMRLLCLFSSEGLMKESFVGRLAEHWSSDIDQGRCEFVPLVIDAEAEAMAVCRIFTSAVLVCGSRDLGPELAALLNAAGPAFAGEGLRLELIPAEAPVTVLAWLAREVPSQVRACHAGGEVRLDSPSWWRDQARRHFSQPGATLAEEAEPEDLTDELRAFISNRGW
jgi:hypothetical protein